MLHGIDDAPRAFQLSVIDADEESGEEEACLAGRGARIPILVHVGDGWFNAKWETACNEMRVGDGMAGTDLIAHEFTHGVRQWSPNAQFDLDLDETFSLSESYADVFGCLVESGGAGAVDWVIGEDTALGAMADLSDPPRAPFHWVDHYDDYEGDDVNLNERHNSGITSKAAVLIVDGGTHHGFTLEGIGRDATRWLYLDTLLALTSNANQADYDHDGFGDAFGIRAWVTYLELLYRNYGELADPDAARWNATGIAGARAILAAQRSARGGFPGDDAAAGERLPHRRMRKVSNSPAYGRSCWSTLVTSAPGGPA